MGILGVPRAFCNAVGATYVTKYFLPPKCRHAFCQVERAHPPPVVCVVYSGCHRRRQVRRGS